MQKGHVTDEECDLHRMEGLKTGALENLKSAILDRRILQRAF